jgi:hypothetical protein
MGRRVRVASHPDEQLPAVFAEFRRVLAAAGAPAGAGGLFPSAAAPAETKLRASRG